MFFTKDSDIAKIASRAGCAIFVLPENTPLKLKSALYLTPDENKVTQTISVEQVREFISLSANKEVQDRFFVISPADAMNEAAQNAFLKTFEEPHDHCHFVLLTTDPAALLPTIRSRAQIFFRKKAGSLDLPPSAKPKVLEMAKKLISATSRNLPDLAVEIAKTKTQPRQYALDVVATAIEMLYKSYFKTQNVKFLTKLPIFLALYDSLEHNGHIKLHLVADLC